MDHLTRIRVQPKQATSRCQPKHPGLILTDLADSVGNFAGVDTIVSESFVKTIKPVQKLIAAHPKRSRTILK
jgi:hypothetical protein